MDYVIKQVTTDHDSLKKVLDLLRVTFPQTTKFTSDYLKWQYVDNPLGEIIGFNAWWGEELAAHYVVMPICMMINGEKITGVLSLNTATHPNHRGKRLFTLLAEKTYQYAAEHGYKFVIGVANANSTHGFLKNLDFELISPLTFKIGVGNNIYHEKEFTFQRFWDKELIKWRLQNPSTKYGQNSNLIVSPIALGFKKILMHNREKSLNSLFLRPFNLYIGLGADLSKGFYMNIPHFIKHSPFNLIWRDLSNGSLPKMTNYNIFFELIDFDVA